MRSCPDTNIDPIFLAGVLILSLAPFFSGRGSQYSRLKRSTVLIIIFSDRKQKPRHVLSESEKEDIIRKKAQMEQQIKTLQTQISLEETARRMARRNSSHLRENAAWYNNSIYLLMRCSFECTCRKSKIKHLNPCFAFLDLYVTQTSICY